MIGRVLLAALLAGIAAGFLMGAIQHVRITPLILEAEKYEHAGGHDHGTADAAATSQEDAWAPQNGLERTFYTTLASIVAARLLFPWMSYFLQIVGFGLPVALLIALYRPRKATPSAAV